MKIIKRDGAIVDYNSDKIRLAIGKANSEVSKKERATTKINKQKSHFKYYMIESFQGILYYVHVDNSGKWRKILCNRWGNIIKKTGGI